MPFCLCLCLCWFSKSNFRSQINLRESQKVSNETRGLRLNLNRTNPNPSAVFALASQQDRHLTAPPPKSETFIPTSLSSDPIMMNAEGDMQCNLVWPRIFWWMTGIEMRGTAMFSAWMVAPRGKYCLFEVTAVTFVLGRDGIILFCWLSEISNDIYRL